MRLVYGKRVEVNGKVEIPETGQLDRAWDAFLVQNLGEGNIELWVDNIRLITLKKEWRFFDIKVENGITIKGYSSNVEICGFRKTILEKMGGVTHKKSEYHQPDYEEIYHRLIRDIANYITGQGGSKR